MTTLEDPRIEETSGQIMPVVHAPGPWRFEDAPGIGDEVCFQVIRDSAGHHVSSTWGGPHLGNAKLIAAAPELLEALLALVDSPNAKENEMWDCARAAIKKAIG